MTATGWANILPAGPEIASMNVTAAAHVRGLFGAGLVNRPALPVQQLEITADVDRVRDEAKALAARAEAYQSQELARGHSISFALAVAHVAAEGA